MSELLALAERVAAQARGGEQIEAYVVRARDTSVRVYDGEIEQLASAQSEGLGVRVIVDGKQGFAYAGTLTEDAIVDALADARDNVTFGTPDPWAGLAEPDGVASPSLALWNDALASTPTDRKVALTMELEKLTAAGDKRVRVESADYGDVLAEGAVATSTGIRSVGRETGCYLSVSTLATEGDETQTGFGFSVGRCLDDLDPARAAADGLHRATRLLGATKPGSGRVTVVLDPFVTAQFLSVLSSTVNGEAVLKGRSLFANRVGDSVAAACFTLVDDPTNPMAYTATEVDGEGLATRRNVLISGGVLQGFVHNAYSGRRAGAASTGSAVRGYTSTPGVGCVALALNPGTRTQAQLVADVSDGVLIQQVSGMHSGVNPISGDFSTGAAGLRITNGTVGAPIKEFTIASTLQKMLLDVVEVGGDVEWLPMSAAGVSLVINDVALSGA
ncbi:MAG: TldD/PmbA family protein [Acidimicrobiia bacterium]